ncbi:hypothetical protein W97_08505 [Coniosporium apollinis CBS 100218]|uniref:Uncharacterized protein n=1 Tax=Coniosporium apollinis (strain CBS 100218) TaxID=1168221 RepID=R7Z4Y1_CONA1|nr:uncharacterized protein W97_08505 [Coniosporium apollinis CBS 100218]EON69245.1 hypothetical protein W97_08505 [Coniosporium apollinis CBS 100218]
MKPAQTNGIDGLLQELHERIPLYEKLAYLQAEVYSGRHPRVKLPQNVLAQVAPQQSAPTAPPPTINGLSGGRLPPPSPSVPQNGAAHPYPKTFANAQHGVGGQQTPSSKPSSSGIDPVLLTPSDTLIRAELQLKRQRIERVLKDQVDAKKGQGWERDLNLDPGLVSDTLLKAQLLVPPISGLAPSTNDNSPSHESFDTNDYYSSQVVSWSTESSEPGEIVDSGNIVPDTAQGSSRLVDDDHGINGKSNGVPHTANLDDRRVDQTGIGAAQPQGQHPPSREAEATEREEDTNLDDDAPMDLEEGEREESYSPPAADAFAPPPHNTLAPSKRDEPAVAQPVVEPRYPFRYPRMRGVQPPSPEVPVIRNHIRSPVAPQPARVSPLTYNKLPRIDQSQLLPPPRSRPQSPRFDRPRKQGQRGNGRAGRRSPKNSGRQSPAAPQEKVKNPKKRRRDAVEGEKERRTSGKRVAMSPEVYIKEEPVSPPPFSGLSEIQGQRQRIYRELPEDVEIVSPRQARARPVYYREQDHAQPVYAYEMDEPTSPTYVRVPSRTAYRRVERDDTDLRRVASLQYARRPYSPAPQTLPYSPVEPQSLRSASYAFAERPRVQEPIYREASVRPAAPRYIRSERSMSPMEQHVPRTYTPTMAPPPRQVVVDQYGNKYHVAPSQNPRTFITPQPQRIEAESHLERAPTRDAAMRASSRVLDPYDDEPSIAHMPPPPLRRYPEQPDVELVDHRAYRQREYSMRPPEPVEASRRPTVQYDDMPPPPPREYVARSYSVRPEPLRQEVEYLPRHGSAVPAREYVRRAEPLAQGVRHASLARMEYAPVEDQRYSHVPQAQPMHSRGYVDDVEIMQGGYEEGGRRVTYRY